MPADPYKPSTKIILDAMVTLAQNLTLLDGVTPAYASVKKGKYKNIAQNTPCLEIHLMDDETQRQRTGGIVRDTQGLILLSIADETNAETVEDLIADIRDAIVTLVHSHVRLGRDATGATQTVSMLVKPGSASFTSILRSGKEYRAHVIGVTVINEWANQHFQQN